MKTKTFFILTSIMLALIIPALAHSAPKAPKPPVLVGFKVWKQERVVNARNALDTYKGGRVEGQVTPPDKGAKPQATKVAVVSKEAGEVLRQLEFNLEIALSLTIHDYFALYLKDKTKTEIASVIPQLSADEVSELLLAYRNQLYGVGEGDSNVSKNIK